MRTWDMNKAYYIEHGSWSPALDQATLSISALDNWASEKSAIPNWTNGP